MRGIHVQGEVVARGTDLHPTTLLQAGVNLPRAAAGAGIVENPQPVAGTARRIAEGVLADQLRPHHHVDVGPGLECRQRAAIGRGQLEHRDLVGLVFAPGHDGVDNAIAHSACHGECLSA
ncbi:hypothetical protein D3C80_1663320 [compost metagenome]